MGFPPCRGFECGVVTDGDLYGAGIFPWYSLVLGFFPGTLWCWDISLVLSAARLFSWYESQQCSIILQKLETTEYTIQLEF